MNETLTVSYTHLDVYKRQIKHIVTVDGPLRGIVDRLYNLGIQPAEATYDLNCFDFNVYCVKIHIPLNQQLNCEVLGDLPAGWYYGWDEETDKICMLGYLDFECYVGAVSYTHLFFSSHSAHSLAMAACFISFLSFISNSLPDIFFSGLRLSLIHI